MCDCSTRLAGTTAATSARGRPRTACHTRTIVSRNASSGRYGFQRSVRTPGPNPRVRMPAVPITPSRRGHRPQRHADRGQGGDHGHVQGRGRPGERPDVAAGQPPQRRRPDPERTGVGVLAGIQADERRLRRADLRHAVRHRRPVARGEPRVTDQRHGGDHEWAGDESDQRDQRDERSRANAAAVSRGGSLDARRIRDDHAALPRARALPVPGMSPQLAPGQR